MFPELMEGPESQYSLEEVEHFVVKPHTLISEKFISLIGLQIFAPALSRASG